MIFWGSYFIIIIIIIIFEKNTIYEELRYRQNFTTVFKIIPHL
jgi:hypothetical protein